VKITGCDIWTVVVPALPGTVNSPEFGPATWDQVPKHIIRLRTDDGVYGLGETSRGCPREAVERAAAQLVDRDPLTIPLQALPLAPRAPEVARPGRAYEGPSGGGRGNAAYDAFEMALFDLVGRALGLPAHALLGGAVRTRVPADFWIGQQMPDDAGRAARRGKEMGFHGLKMKCAIDDPWVERMQAILDAAGPEFMVTIDPNERFYRPAEAIRLAMTLERFPNIAIYEDPVPKWNLDWYVQIRAAITVPVALHLGNPHDVVNAIKAEACDHMNLGGGMVQFVRNAAMAAAAGMLCWHGSGVDLGITEHSYLHAAACARNCVLPSDLVGSWVREDDLIVDGLRFEDGHAILPDKPGLGCELDEAALERYSVPVQ
jgi:muconate cycloisomerase